MNHYQRPVCNIEHEHSLRVAMDKVSTAIEYVFKGNKTHAANVWVNLSGTDPEKYQRGA